VSATARRVRIVLAYDGAAYAGWQIQPDRPTVQATLESALTRIQGGRPAHARGAGRTDAGVHAIGQVADVEIATPFDDGRLLHALRAMLPDDVRPVDLATVADSFNARRDARSKSYVYLLDRSPAGHPCLRGYALRVRRALDLAAVRDALERIPGRRDWSGFTAAACEIEDRVRTITEAVWIERDDGRAALRFSGDGFLTHMVRNLVGTVLAVGSGRFAPGRIDEILARGDRGLAGPTAPPHGLTLRRVVYDDHAGPGVGAWPVPD